MRFILNTCYPLRFLRICSHLTKHEMRGAVSYLALRRNKPANTANSWAEITKFFPSCIPWEAGRFRDALNVMIRQVLSQTSKVMNDIYFVSHDAEYDACEDNTCRQEPSLKLLLFLFSPSDRPISCWKPFVLTLYFQITMDPNTKWKTEPIAIIGSSCRFPGNSNSPSKLWELLEDPRDLRVIIPPDRFNIKGFYHRNGEHHGVSDTSTPN